MVLVLAFVAGIGATFLLGDGNSTPWLPLWVEAYLDVAKAMKTLWYHQTSVQQLESWVGMSLSMFSAALPTIIIGGFAKELVCLYLLTPFRFGLARSIHFWQIIHFSKACSNLAGQTSRTN